jgi:toxin FitB
LYLVETNVISAGAPSGVVPLELVDWMDAHSVVLFLSAVTIAEIEDGIVKMRREGATRKATELAAWMETLVHLYDDRILAFDTPTARIAGALSDQAREQDQAPGFRHIIIAATGQRHGLTILSRNCKHFEPLGIEVLDPFVALPPV